MKCALCNKNIETTFLGKILGTYVKADKKKKTVCRDCQQKNSMDDIKKKI